jgi:hypothetical protein
MIEVGNQVRVKKTGEIGLVRHIMFYKPFDFFIGKKTYMVGEIAKSYQINEIELFDKQVEREEKLNQLFANNK